MGRYPMYARTSKVRQCRGFSAQMTNECQVALIDRCRITLQDNPVYDMILAIENKAKSKTLNPLYEKGKLLLPSILKYLTQIK